MNVIGLVTDSSPLTVKILLYEGSAQSTLQGRPVDISNLDSGSHDIKFNSREATFSSNIDFPRFRHIYRSHLQALSGDGLAQSMSSETKLVCLRSPDTGNTTTPPHVFLRGRRNGRSPLNKSLIAN